MGGALLFYALFVIRVLLYLVKDCLVEHWDLLQLILFQAVYPFAKVSFVLGLVRLLHHLHIILDVLPINSVLQNIRVKFRFLIFLELETRKLLDSMRDIQPSVAGPLHAGKYFSSIAGSFQPNVQNCFEGPLVLVLLLVHLIILPIYLLLPLVNGIQVVPLQQSPRQQ